MQKFKDSNRRNRSFSSKLDKFKWLVDDAYSNSIRDYDMIQRLQPKFRENFAFTKAIRNVKNEENAVVSKSGSRQCTIELQVDLRRSRGTLQQAPLQKAIRSVYNSSYRLPFIDSDLWAQISRTNPSSLPERVIKTDRISVRDKDLRTLDNYSRRCRNYGRRFWSTLAMAGWEAATDLGLSQGVKTHRERPLGISETVDSLIKPTNAGAPSMKKKNADGIASSTKKIIRNLFESPSLPKIICSKFASHQLEVSSSLDAFYMLPEVIFHRFQSSFNFEDRSISTKSRVVWCVPYAIVALEKMFFGRIVERILNKNMQLSKVIYPTKLNQRDIGVKSVNTIRKEIKDYMRMPSPTLDSRYRLSSFHLYSLDYSGYDSTIPNVAKDLFFSIMRANLELTPHEDIIYNYLRTYIKYSPYVSNGELFFKSRGISSGLYITNVFDTWFNLTLIRFMELLDELDPGYLDRLNSDLANFDDLSFSNETLVSTSFHKFPVRVMGDDGLLFTSGMHLNRLRAVCRNLDMELSVKFISSRPFNVIFFLGRYWDENGYADQTEEYMTCHIVTRTNYYDESLLPFPLEELNINRILSICLPYKSGLRYLEKTFYNWEPYIRFKRERRGFSYMRDFYNTGFEFIPYEESFDTKNY